MSRRFGLDAWAVAVHAFVTICVAVAVGSAVRGPDEDIAIPLVFGASALLFEWRRRRALKEMGPVGLTTGEAAAQRMGELEDRVAEIDLLHARLTELEERVDFSERLLAQARQVPAGRDDA